MINIPYLLKVLKTTDLEILVQNIDAPLLDINVALFEAEDNGEIEVNRKKGKVKVLVDVEPSRDDALAEKILKIMRHYEKKEINISVGKLTSWAKNSAIDYNYPYHVYICTLQSLIDSGEIQEQEVSVPKLKDRPYHRFVFLCFDGNPNEDWNAKEVQKWITNWENNKVK